MEWERKYVELCLSCKTSRETRVLTEDEMVFLKHWRATCPDRTAELDVEIRDRAFASVNPFA